MQWAVLIDTAEGNICKKMWQAGFCSQLWEKPEIWLNLIVKDYTEGKDI